MATLPSASLNAIPLSSSTSAKGRPTTRISKTEPRKKVPLSKSTSLRDGETCARHQSMYGVPPTTKPEVFYTIPLTPLPYSNQHTFPGTPHMTPRSPFFSPVDSTKQSPSYKPPAYPVGVSEQRQYTDIGASEQRQHTAIGASEQRQHTAIGASEQRQHTPIGDTPKLATRMRKGKLPLSNKEVSDNEAYPQRTATPSIRTLTSINTRQGTSNSKTASLGAPRPASAVSPDRQYYNTQQSSTAGSSMGSDRVFLSNSRLTTKPMDSNQDSVEYESSPVYYNLPAILPGREATFSSTRTPKSLATTSPPTPALPPRPRKPAPPVAPKPDYLHSHNPFAKQGPPDPFMLSGAVVGLTKKTFKKFIKDLDAAFVMFYDPCDKKCCGARVNMRQAAHTTQKENHAFAAVDCTKECELCKKEKVHSFPTMKLYVKGLTIDTYEYVPLLASEIRQYVENAPIVREVKLEKHRCSIQ